jgi:peptidyl-dipeptidase Dcp
MKRLIMLLFAGTLIFTSCSTEQKNPLLAKWDTPFETPPFDKIKTEHYLPAFKEAIKKHNNELDKIVKNSDEATFANTIEALDYSGTLLRRVRRVFSSMNESMSNEQMQLISKEVSPMLSKHNDDINLNENLFGRVKEVYEMRESLGLDTEQNKLLEKYYKDFVRGGANLKDESK